MGRSRGGSRPSARPATTASRPATQNKPAPVQNKPAAAPPPKAAPAPTQAPPAPAPQQGGGMGMLGMMGSMAAGTVLGNVISDRMLGGGGEAAPAAGMEMSQAPQQPCSQFRWAFDSCLASNQANISPCQNTFEQYRDCMANAPTYTA